MQTAVIEPGRAVKVGPGEPDASDILEYAEALIEEEGWNQMGKPDSKTSSPEVGWTLHDAIGEANTRLFPQSLGGMGKEGITMRSGESTRAAATQAVLDALPATAKRDDKAFNDKAKNKTAVLAVLRKAKEALRS